MRTDFENISDGQRIKLFPNSDNPLHKKPVIATHSGGYYYCDNSSHPDGPDYYYRDVGQYNNGFEIIKE